MLIHVQPLVLSMDVVLELIPNQTGSVQAKRFQYLLTLHITRENLLPLKCQNFKISMVMQINICKICDKYVNYFVMI